MTSRDLTEKRANLVTEMRTITTAPNGEAGDLSAEQNEKFDMLKTELLRIEKQLERQRYLDEQERRMAGESLSGHGDTHLDHELRNYSLIRAVGGMIGLEVDDGFEREVARECEKRSGQSFEGRAVPMAVFTSAPYEQRVVTTAAPGGGPGSNLISTDFRGDQFIDLLRPKSVIYRAGATLLDGLIGNVAIPARKTSTGFAWIAENTALTPSDHETAQVTLSPKHGGGVTEYSRNMFMQTTPSVESLFRADMSAVIASGIDRAAIVGGGANEPVGILATNGIGDVPGGENGLAPTWANVLALIAAVENANGTAMGFLTTPNAVKKMRSSVRVASTDSRMIQEDPNSLAGYPLASSTNVPSNLVKGGSGAVCSPLIYGDWSDVLIGLWSAIDFLVNPYESAAYLKGNILIRAMCTLDIKLRHVGSFAATKDLLTT
jgi:HK97 family phage major capsid protein